MNLFDLPDKKYRTIYADPPWLERGCGQIKRGADRHYPLMKTKDIAALPIWKLREEKCHLYLWVTNNHLKHGLKVMGAWGFRYVTAITWVKPTQGLGQFFRGRTEHCLFGVTGTEDRHGQGETVIVADRGRHSEKPPRMRGMIEQVSFAPRIELFAREDVVGWDCWGYRK